MSYVGMLIHNSEKSGELVSSLVENFPPITISKYIKIKIRWLEKRHAV